MSCEKAQSRISSLVDRGLPAGEREDVLAHIGNCRECSNRLESIENLRAALRRMDRVAVPVEVSAKLRVIASHERERQMARASFSALLHYWSGRVRLYFDNLMRPVALPVAGGSLSALIFFGLLVPSLSFPHNFADRSLMTSPDGEVVLMDSNGNYVPDWMRIEPADATNPDDANVILLSIDKEGRVSDYSVLSGHLTPDLLSIIIMDSRFQPATFLGLPTSGTVKLVQRRTRNVRS